MVAISFFGQYETFLNLKSVWGVGLLPGVNASAEFFKTQDIKGPVFNDYDIGGYLIYHTRSARGSGHAAADIRADQAVFVDNRPEAYSVDFFEKVYKPAQTDPEAWKQLDNKYDFNTIFFSHRDYTPWAQAFLISRIQDPAWAPVFVDSYNIIFLKRNLQNEALIKKYEIPKSRFGIVSSK